MSFVLYTQILKKSVLKPASPGITLILLKGFSVFFAKSWHDLYISWGSILGYKDVNGTIPESQFYCGTIEEQHKKGFSLSVIGPSMRLPFHLSCQILLTALYIFWEKYF